MPYVMVVEVQPEGQTLPTRSTIEFELPSGSTDADVVLVAKGIRKGFRDAYSTKVKVVSLQQVAMSRDVALGA